jgi:hypothetical protein
MKPQVHPLTSIVVTIVKPTSGSDVPGGGAFKTYGKCNTGGCTYTAQATDGTNTYTGTATTPPPGNQWAFNFTGCPVNVELTLTVTATDAGGSGSSSVEFTCTSP